MWACSAGRASGPKHSTPVKIESRAPSFSAEAIYALAIVVSIWLPSCKARRMPVLNATASFQEGIQKVISPKLIMISLAMILSMMMMLVVKSLMLLITMMTGTDDDYDCWVCV